MSIKITKKLLSTYRKTKSEITLLERELAYMKQGDNGFGNSTILDYSTGEARAQAVIGFDWERYGRRQQELEKKRARCKAVEDWIEGIEDTRTRAVFRMRYIEGLAWENIATKTGYASSPDYPRLMIRDKFLKKNGIS